MILKNLTCFLFNDLDPSERSSIEPILENLSQFAQIETIWVTEAQRRFFKKRAQGDFWIVARDWRRALDFLSVKSYNSGKVFVSILYTPQEEKQLYGLSFQPFFSSLPKSTTLIVYSPLEYRFFRDIKKIPESQLKLGSLMMPKRVWQSFPNRNSGKFQVGTFCDFSMESNINFLLCVAHFVSKQSSQIHFNILGRGPLYNHFSRMVSALDLNKAVSIIETVSESVVGSLDLFLYAPLRNYHFIPVMIAGAYQVPVISVEIPGIEDFIVPEKSGILIPSYEIKTMGIKILELYQEQSRRNELGLELNAQLCRSASLNVVTQQYQNLFFGEESFNEKNLEKAA